MFVRVRGIYLYKILASGIHLHLASILKSTTTLFHNSNILTFIIIIIMFLKG